MYCFTLFLALVATVLPTLVSARFAFAHFMVGNSYPYVPSDWQEDILAAMSYGIDGFALNVGSDDWQPARVADAYAAAEAIATQYPHKTPFKLFISFDMTCLSDPSLILTYLRTYHGHPAQFVYEGKDFVSTFSGEYVTLGQDTANDGWQIAIKDPLAGEGIEIYFVPAWSAFDPTTVYQSNPVVDGVLCWTAWPDADVDMTADKDLIYLQNANATGKTYMAAWSPWFHTHFSYKNWIYKSESLYVDRWNELISLAPPMIELLTWNDYGESHYFYKTKGALPAGSEEWVDGFDHSAWGVLLHFFIASYKSGKTIPTGIADPTTDVFHNNLVNLAAEKVVFWYRSHPKMAVASADPLPQPTSFTFADDDLHVVALLHSPGTIVVTSGGQPESYSAVEGFNEFVFTGFQEGEQQVELVRDGSVVACGIGDVPISSTIDKYNFNAVVKRAVPGGC